MLMKSTRNSVSSPTVATSAKSPYSTITRSPREDGDGMTATTSQYADPNLDPEHQMVEFYPDYSGSIPHRFPLVYRCFVNLIWFSSGIGICFAADVLLSKLKSFLD